MQKYSKFLNIVKKNNPGISKDQIKIFDDGWDHIVMVANGMAYYFPRNKEAEETLLPPILLTQEFAKSSPVPITVMEFHQEPIIFATYKFIKGVRFEKELLKQFSKAENNKIASQIGQFLTALHSFDKKKAKQLGLKQQDAFKAWTKGLKIVDKKIFPFLNEQEKAWVNKLYKDFISLIKKYPFTPVVIHWDIRPEHIIVNEATHTLSGIIDFGDLEIADPAYDFFYLEWAYDKDFYQQVLKSYGLKLDKYFALRVRFYQDTRYITYLLHSLKLKDKARIKIHKKQLTEYIKNNPLFSIHK